MKPESTTASSSFFLLLCVLALAEARKGEEQAVVHAWQADPKTRAGGVAALLQDP